MTKQINVQIGLEKNMSYEIRFYCDLCDIEISENEQKTHKCEDES